MSLEAPLVQSGSCPGGWIAESPSLLMRDPFRSKLKRPDRRLDFSAVAHRPASSAETHAHPPRAATPPPPRPSSSAAVSHGVGGSGERANDGRADVRRRSFRSDIARMFAESAAVQGDGGSAPAAARPSPMCAASPAANGALHAGSRAGARTPSPPQRGAPPEAARAPPLDEVPPRVPGFNGRACYYWLRLRCRASG
jgi:hypothetical protein